jgi:hypothetical protein
MKKIFTTAILFAALCSFSPAVGIEDVIGAIKTGNAAQMARFFDSSVEISMPDKSNSYSKSQAEMVLRDFFSNNAVKNFQVIHKGESAGSQYCIGTLQTKNGAFRTTIFMKQKKETQVLQELRFENR